MKPPPPSRTAARAALLCAAVLAAVALPVPAQTIDAPAASGDARVIVKLRTGSPLMRKRALSAAAERIGLAEDLGQRLGLAMSAGAAVSDRAQVVFAEGITSDELARRLTQESDVAYAVPDRRRHAFAAPNDPLYAAGVPGNGPAVGQWYLRAPAGVVKSALDIETAWNVTQGSPGIVVAVLDTGVRFDHPDLLPVAAGGSLLPGYDMVTDVSIANDGDGRDADAADPGDWVTQAELALVGGPFHNCSPAPRNSSWHGTQVAGLIAALTDNGVGMAGVGRNVRVLPVRVLGKCGGYDSDIIAGMRWAAGLPVAGEPANANQARVINMSLGEDGECTAAYRDALAEVNAAGTVVVAAAGNSAGHAVTSPANCEGVLGIAALRHVGTKVGFSDLGLEIALSAPGGNCVNTTAGAPCLYPILTTSNSGRTTPGGPIYTDSFNRSIGTSFSAPLVAGTVALMLSAQPSLTPLQVRLLLEATARPFPTTGGDNGDGTVVPQCAAPKLDALGNLVDQLQCYCTIDTCGAGMLDAGAAVVAAATGTPAPTLLAQGLWWAAPGGSESGWGLWVAHAGDVVFLGWFTYDTAGMPWWLTMTATRTAANTYAGTVIQSRGPAFDSVPFDPGRVTRTPVGTATLNFSDRNRGSFAYTVNGDTRIKPISRVAFDVMPTCTFGAQPDFAHATNYQDVWWVAGGAESGWGLALTQQGDVVFVGWFTYDPDGSPRWLSGTATKVGPGRYAGELVRSTGPAFGTVPFDPADVARVPVGTLTLTFAGGDTARFDYTVNGIAQTKQLTRALLAPPAGTVCN